MQNRPFGRFAVKLVRSILQEEKIRIVLENLRGEDSIAELCRREGIDSSLYYTWS